MLVNSDDADYTYVVATRFEHGVEDGPTRAGGRPGCALRQGTGGGKNVVDMWFSDEHPTAATTANPARGNLIAS